MIKKLSYSILLSLIFLNTIVSEGFTNTNSLSVAVNPIKIISSLVNIEIDYCILDEFSIHGFIEYLIADYLIQREVHPDVVVRIGPRYIPNLLGEKYDTYIGPFISYSISSINSDSGLEFGVELGGRYKLISKLFIQLKGMAMYSINMEKIIPGFEGLIGYSIGNR